jgi:hypothetical protein
MLVSFIFMELFAWLLVGFALYGALLNSNGQALRSYKVWLFSNAGFVAYNAVIGSYAQCALFFAYFLIAVNGYHRASSQAKCLKACKIWTQWQKKHNIK